MGKHGSGDEDGGIALLLQPDPLPGNRTLNQNRRVSVARSGFSSATLKRYRGCFAQIFLEATAFRMRAAAYRTVSTQAIVGRGIHDADIGLIWLILLGGLMIVTGTHRHRLHPPLAPAPHLDAHQHLACRGDFFIKLLKLPMSFFDTQLMGACCNAWATTRACSRFLRTDSRRNVYDAELRCVWSRAVLSTVN